MLSHCVRIQVTGSAGGGNPRLPIQRHAPSAVRRALPSECRHSQVCTSPFSVHPCCVTDGESVHRTPSAVYVSKSLGNMKLEVVAQ